jgi:hypothetical protein
MNVEWVNVAVDVDQVDVEPADVERVDGDGRMLSGCILSGVHFERMMLAVSGKLNRLHNGCDPPTSAPGSKARVLHAALFGSRLEANAAHLKRERQHVLETTFL